MFQNPIVAARNPRTLPWVIILEARATYQHNIQTAKPCGLPAPWIFHGIYKSGCHWAGCFGPMLGQLGLGLGHLRFVLGLCRAILALFWACLGLSGAHFGTILAILGVSSADLRLS